ncbi:hypothetical protein GGX14DRAFT_659748 [Mycena pura]|uniref:Uncharacterized protein n=1 Tax=Mycena pura TaxID=153505 RepID=A0AAD6V2J9_9AGAR|nr:hypothetical protein GGX14DRAFT_659748 [Mycena pura]
MTIAKRNDDCKGTVRPACGYVHRLTAHLQPAFGPMPEVQSLMSLSTCGHMRAQQLGGGSVDVRVESRIWLRNVNDAWTRVSDAHCRRLHRYRDCSTMLNDMESAMDALTASMGIETCTCSGACLGCTAPLGDSVPRARRCSGSGMPALTYAAAVTYASIPLENEYVNLTVTLGFRISKLEGHAIAVATEPNPAGGKLKDPEYDARIEHKLPSDNLLEPESDATGPSRRATAWDPPYSVAVRDSYGIVDHDNRRQGNATATPGRAPFHRAMPCGDRGRSTYYYFRPVYADLDPGLRWINRGPDAGPLDKHPRLRSVKIQMKSRRSRIPLSEKGPVNRIRKSTRSRFMQPSVTTARRCHCWFPYLCESYFDWYNSISPKGNHVNLRPPMSSGGPGSPTFQMRSDEQASEGPADVGKCSALAPKVRSEGRITGTRGTTENGRRWGRCHHVTFSRNRVIPIERYLIPLHCSCQTDNRESVSYLQFNQASSALWPMRATGPHDQIMAVMNQIKRDGTGPPAVTQGLHALRACCKATTHSGNVMRRTLRDLEGGPIQGFTLFTVYGGGTRREDQGSARHIAELRRGIRRQDRERGALALHNLLAVSAAELRNRKLWDMMLIILTVRMMHICMASAIVAVIVDLGRRRGWRLQRRDRCTMLHDMDMDTGSAFDSTPAASMRIEFVHWHDHSQSGDSHVHVHPSLRILDTKISLECGDSLSATSCQLQCGPWGFGGRAGNLDTSPSAPGRSQESCKNLKDTAKGTGTEYDARIEHKLPLEVIIAAYRFNFPRVLPP